MLGYMLEVQVGFMAIRVARDEFVFLPKLRAICILDRIVEQVRKFSYLYFQTSYRL